MIDVTDETFVGEVLESTSPVMVAFWATWSAASRVVQPLIAETAARFADRAKIVLANPDANPSACLRFGITTIPTLLFIKNGAEYERLVGPVQLPLIEAALHRGL